ERPNIYTPVCDVLGSSNQADGVLQAAIRFCESACMCYGGPISTFILYPGGPPSAGPVMPATIFLNGAAAAQNRAGVGGQSSAGS
ncbi:MAG: hypothetical protein M1830_000562, partial [Pleopsidium flavum]